MRVDIVLNPEAADQAETRAQLAAELTALQQKGIVVAQRTKEVDVGSLGLHEVYQFVVEVTAGATPPLLFAKIVVDLVNAVLRRRQSDASSGMKTVDKASPSKAINITINQQSINLPATDSQLKRFLSKLANDEKVDDDAQGARRGKGRPVSKRPRKGK